MYTVRFMPPAEKFIKKLNEKPLLLKIRSIIDDIIKNPYTGEPKTGDLSGFYCRDFNYNKTDYRIAYTLEEINGSVIVVVMIGTRENFYIELKRYMN